MEEKKFIKWKVFLYNEVIEREKVLCIKNTEIQAVKYANSFVPFLEGVDVIICIQPFNTKSL